MAHASPVSLHVYDIDGVAAALGVSPGRFRNIRRKLEAGGFPRALPVLTARWSVAAVHGWIAANGAAGPAPALDALVAEASARLDARYAGRAA